MVPHPRRQAHRKVDVLEASAFLEYDVEYDEPRDASRSKAAPFRQLSYAGLPPNDATFPVKRPVDPRITICSVAVKSSFAVGGTRAFATRDPRRHLPATHGSGSEGEIAEMLSSGWAHEGLPQSTGIATPGGYPGGTRPGLEEQFRQFTDGRIREGGAAGRAVRRPDHNYGSGEAKSRPRSVASSIVAPYRRQCGVRERGTAGECPIEFSCLPRAGLDR